MFAISFLGEVQLQLVVLTEIQPDFETSKFSRVIITMPLGYLVSKVLVQYISKAGLRLGPGQTQDTGLDDWQSQILCLQPEGS